MGRRRNRAVVDPSCRGCVYAGYLCSQSAYKGRPDFCSYILTTGHSRPCPAGAGCTVRQTGGRKRRRVEN